MTQSPYSHRRCSAATTAVVSHRLNFNRSQQVIQRFGYSRQYFSISSGEQVNRAPYTFKHSDHCPTHFDIRPAATIFFVRAVSTILAPESSGHAFTYSNAVALTVASTVTAAHSKNRQLPCARGAHHWRSADK
jgi:hypothetical protein